MALPSKSTGYFVTAMESLRDPIRSTHWRLRFNVPAIKSQMGASATKLLQGIDTDDDLSIMVKTTSIPKIVINTAQAYYMGQSIDFATNTEFEKTSSLELLEPSDMIGMRFLGLWNQLVHNVDAIDVDTDGNAAISPDGELGVNLGAGKFSVTDFAKSVVRNSGWVYLEMYDYTYGNVLFRVNYINCWPKEIGGGSLAHEGPNLVKFNVTLNHDRYKFILPSKFGVK